MLIKPKYLLLMPLIWQQAKQVKKETIRLPEPTGKRQGVIPISNPVAPTKTNINTQNTTAYHLMIIGDSSAAGVGVKNQSDALASQLVINLTKQSKLRNNYHLLNWQLQATTGHNSFDVLTRLYALPTPAKPLNLMIVVVGVNDTTQMLSVTNWNSNLKEIIAIAKRKYHAKNIIFSAIPPVKNFPALPVPLNGLIADKATELDNAMAQVCDEYDSVYYVSFDIPFKPSVPHAKATKAIKGASNEYFASDGFHPSKLTYKVWAEQLANFITTL